jgi:hypothetical protein
LKYPYKSYPNSKGGQDWSAILNVQIANPARHSPPTKRFEALIDSGASRCIFHSSLGLAIGLDVKKGEVEETLGVSGQPTITYLHNVSLYVSVGIIKSIQAGFTEKLPVGGLLGRLGFFEYFKITFDPSSNPPGFELERIHKI